MKNILTTENLCFSAGDKELIHKISLEIPKGSFGRFDRT